MASRPGLVVAAVLLWTTVFSVVGAELGRVHAVPAAPNGSEVVADVLGYAVIHSRLVGIQPAQTLYVLTVEVNSTKPLGEGDDALKERVGEVLELFSKGKLEPDLYGKTIRAHVVRRGDERLVRFWLQGDVAVLDGEADQSGCSVEN